MTTGIRAELSFEDSESCQIAQITGEQGVDTTGVSRSVAPETGQVTEEFVVEGADGLEAPDLEQVFSYGSRDIYRFTRDSDIECPCETVEEFGSPVVDVHTEDGTLKLALHVEDMDELQEVIGEVRTRFSDVTVDRLVSSEPAGETPDLVLVDRGELTPRQLEVIETAHEMGYFTHPKGANAGEVADTLDITTSTFTEHLSAAQTKLLGAILG